jgi:copper chaperone NosL
VNSEKWEARSGKWEVRSGKWTVKSGGVLVVFVMVALFVSGCGRQVDMEAPPEIVYGRDVCSRCGMIIEDARFAAAYMTTDGEARIFDDIGDMLVHQTDEGEEVYAYWVHDYETEAWLRGETAHYVLTSEIHTPMGYGLLAFADSGRATAFALRNHGHLLTFTELGAKTSMLTSSHGHGSHHHGGHSHP